MLTEAQVHFFHTEGYLVVPGVLSESDLAGIRGEYDTVLDEAATDLLRRELIADGRADLPFAERYMTLVAECPELYRYLGISLPLSNDPISPDECRAHTGPELFKLLRHPQILDVVESIIGPEILSNPVQQARIKPPMSRLRGTTTEYSNIGSTTWHQDYGAVMDDAIDTDMLTVWVAITDAREDMGCLEVIPRSHLRGELALHCPAVNVPGENYIPAGLLADRSTVTLPATAGTVVLLSKWTEHGATDNVSTELRWSFDLRYQPIGQPTGRPAFPAWVARSRSHPGTELTEPAEYARLWGEARERIIAGSHDGPVYEQERWVANATNPLCA